jgi:hypothetical protein
MGASSSPADPAPDAWQVSLRHEMTALGGSADGRFADCSDPRYAFVPVTRLLEPPDLRPAWAAGTGTVIPIDGAIIMRYHSPRAKPWSAGCTDRGRSEIE